MMRFTYNSNLSNREIQDNLISVSHLFVSSDEEESDSDSLELDEEHVKNGIAKKVDYSNYYSSKRSRTENDGEGSENTQERSRNEELNAGFGGDVDIESMERMAEEKKKKREEEIRKKLKRLDRKERKEIKEMKRKIEKRKRMIEEARKEEKKKKAEEKRKYENKKKAVFEKWATSMDSLANSYLIFLGANTKLPGTDVFPGSVKQLIPLGCECGHSASVSKVNLFLWHGVSKKHVVSYCRVCKPLPAALIEMGFFPLTPTQPKNAVHFGFCEVVVRLRNIFAGSGGKIAEFCRAQNPDCGEALTAEHCSNMITFYSKMIIIANNKKMPVEEKKCFGYPDITEESGEDK